MEYNLLRRLSRIRMCRRLAGKPFLYFASLTWRVAPAGVRQTGIFRSYGRLIHRLVRLREDQFPSKFTRFMRNRPQLEMLRDLVLEARFPAPVRLAVLGCGRGAEVYSIKWLLREAGIDTAIVGVDISDSVLQSSREARFQVGDDALEYLSEKERGSIFDLTEGTFVVTDTLRYGVTWEQHDISAPDLARVVGLQDIVVVNNVLIHMSSGAAAHCLRQVVGLVAPGGYLCVSGIDLDVRTQVASELGLEPVTSSVEKIHNGYLPILDEWPWHYWGLEPYCPSHPDHDFRYSTFFRVRGSDPTRRPATMEPAHQS